MADSSSKRGRQDRARVSSQAHENAYLMKKYRCSRQQVAGARRAVGNSRAKVEAYLRER
jgi:hypothetical protein